MKKKHFNILFIVSFFGAMFLMLYGMYLKNNNGEKTAEQLENIILGLMVVAVIAKYGDKIFSRWIKKESKENS